MGADVKKNLVTLPLIHAYDKASKIAKTALKNNTTIKHEPL